MRPVQTNEVGRSAALVGGFLLVAQQTGLPFRLLELGSSAGLNLLWDQFRYEGAGVAWGEATPPVRLRPHYEAPPPFGVSAAVVERRGCDAAPVDPLSQEGRLIMRSYVWPDQCERNSAARERFVARREASTGACRPGRGRRMARGQARPAHVECRHRRLSLHRHAVPHAQGPRTRREDDRSAWSTCTPIGTARVATDGTGGRHLSVRLTLWPGGSDVLVATAGEHGSPVRWLAGATPDP